MWNLFSCLSDIEVIGGVCLKFGKMLFEIHTWLQVLWEVEELVGFICLATEWMHQLTPQPVRLMMQVAHIPEPEW